MRGVDEHELVVVLRNLHVLLEDPELVAAVFVEADLADAEDAGFVDELGDEGDDVVRQLQILRFLRIDAQPAVVLDAELGGALRLILGDLAEVVVEAVGAGTVKACPEGGFADGLTTGDGHALVVVRGAADHVAVGFDVVHPGGSSKFQV
jgi:hypothetical protein